MHPQDKKNEMRCDRCGQPGIIAMEGWTFCADCYQEAGASCMELDGDRIWAAVEGEMEKSSSGYSAKMESEYPD